LAGQKHYYPCTSPGIGIPPEYKERIFGVFQRLQLQEGVPGTGMGLAIVRRAVDRVDGRCGVEPAPDGGSRFWVELPQVSRAPADRTASAAEQACLKY